MNFRSMSRDDGVELGIWLNSDSVVSAELAGLTGFDWAVLDWEHGICDFNGILGKLRALTPAETVPVVRVPANDPVYIKKALDLGAGGIMVPGINNAAEAAAAVSYMRYAPEGVRGMASSCRAAAYGREFRDYFPGVNERLLKSVQIETATGAGNVDAIAAVPGVDMLFLGHSDLSASLGIYGDYSNPEVLRIEKAVLAACRKHGKSAGLIVRNRSDLARYISAGFRFIIVAVDISMLRQAMDSALTECRNLVADSGK